MIISQNCQQQCFIQRGLITLSAKLWHKIVFFTDFFISYLLTVDPVLSGKLVISQPFPVSEEKSIEYQLCVVMIPKNQSLFGDFLLQLVMKKKTNDKGNKNDLTCRYYVQAALPTCGFVAQRNQYAKKTQFRFRPKLRLSQDSSPCLHCSSLTGTTSLVIYHLQIKVKFI